MAVTLTSNYRDVFAPETLTLIDGFVDSLYDLDAILEFIDEHSEEDFREYYELYVELGESHSYEAVDGFIELNDLFDLKHFEKAYIGYFPSAADFAEDFFEGETSRMDYRIVIDWEETARFLLDDGDIQVHAGKYYYRRYW
jgi:hypothetical protein